MLALVRNGYDFAVEDPIESCVSANRALGLTPAANGHRADALRGILTIHPEKGNEDLYYLVELALPEA